MLTKHTGFTTTTGATLAYKLIPVTRRVALIKTIPAPGRIEFVLLMAGITALDAFSIDAMLPALAQIGSDLGVSVENSLQYVVTALFSGFAAGVLFYGFIADSIGRRKPVVFGILIYIAGSVLCISAESFNTMLIGRVLQGIGAAGPYVLAIAIVRDSYQGEAMARILSLIMMVFIGVPMIAPFVGQGILIVAGWRMIFVALTLYSLCMLIWFWQRQPETLDTAHRSRLSYLPIKSSIVRVLTHPLTLSYLLAIGLLAGAFIAYLSTAQQIFQGMYDLGTRFPVVFASLAAMFGIGSLVNSSLVERFGAVTMVRLAITVIIIASLVYLWMTPDFSALATLKIHIAYNAVVVFCFAFLFGNTTSIAMEPMGDIAGAASSVINSLSTIIAIVVATIIGAQLANSAHPVAIGYLITASLSLLLTFGPARFAGQSDT